VPAELGGHVGLVVVAAVAGELCPPALACMREEVPDPADGRQALGCHADSVGEQVAHLTLADGELASESGQRLRPPPRGGELVNSGTEQVGAREVVAGLDGEAVTRSTSAAAPSGTCASPWSPAGSADPASMPVIHRDRPAGTGTAARCVTLTPAAYGPGPGRVPARGRTVPDLPIRRRGRAGSVAVMILVTGATGTIGAEVVRQLTAAGERVRAMAREPSRADVPADVEVVRADFDDASSLERAVAGTRAVFLATAPGPAIPRHDTALLAAARAAGVAKIVKLSAIGTTMAGEPDRPAGRAPVKVGTWHRPGEEAIRAGGAAWTVPRPSGYASNTLRWAQAIRAGTPVPNMTGAGAQGVTDPRDVAAVAAALTSPAWHSRVLTLTGPEALSVPDQARLLSRVLGRPVRTVDVPLGTARRLTAWSERGDRGRLGGGEGRNGFKPDQAIGGRQAEQLPHPRRARPGQPKRVVVVNEVAGSQIPGGWSASAWQVT